jgi:hypothetical protein
MSEPNDRQQLREIGHAGDVSMVTLGTLPESRDVNRQEPTAGSSSDVITPAITDKDHAFRGDVRPFQHGLKMVGCGLR